jgi:hypothetical protein
VTTPYSQTIEIDGIRHAIPIGKDILAQDAVYADLMDRTRAALDQPEPQGLPPGYIDPEHTGADRHLLQVFYRACQSEGGTADEINLRGIRAVLADAALAQPEPQGASDEEIYKLALDGDFLIDIGDGFSCAVQDEVEFARAVLARWGHPTIEPVPMSEQLPGPEDLDHEGTCWMFHPANFHYCLCRPDPSVHTHWLPHYALPVPQQEEVK